MRPKTRSSERSKPPSRGRRGRRPAGLTPRQRQVVKLVCDGLTNREIAEQLGISVRTVEVHRFNLMRRLRVHNVAQLYQAAVRLRLVRQRIPRRSAAAARRSARKDSWRNAVTNEWRRTETEGWPD